MNTPTDLHAIGLLLLVQRLQARQRPLNRATIVPFAALKLPRVEKNYDALVQSLVGQGLATGNGDAFDLTSQGTEAVAAAAQQYSLNALFYNEYYQAVTGSPAHAEFCQRVYGKDLCQHGMTNLAQLHTLLTAFNVGPETCLLDFGCGDGRITEYIADTTGAQVAGVDIAAEAIRLAQARTQTRQDQMRFYWADFERGQGDFPAGPFDVIIALDSIFFAADLHGVVQGLLARLKPGGRLGIFYHAQPGVEADQTPLAAVLDEFHVPYQVIDLSPENAAHWEHKKAVLLELAPRFAAEDNLFLYQNRMAECESDLGSFQRYLYQSAR